MSETTRITTLDGNKDFMAYVARPEGTPRAAIVVIQEIFGVKQAFAANAICWPKTVIWQLLRTSSGSLARVSSSIPISNRNSRRPSI